MPRFVVLRHDWPTQHWDLMLENGAALRTWRLSRSPDFAGPIEIQRLADHRLAYLEYEGPVSGNRGTVTRILEGRFEIARQEPWLLELSLTSPRGVWRGIITGPAAAVSAAQPDEPGEIVFHPGDSPDSDPSPRQHLG